MNRRLPPLLEISSEMPFISRDIKGQAMGHNKRTARIGVRIAPEALAIVKRAAELQGQSISDFVVAAAQEAAARAIEATQIIRLAIEDQRAVAEAIFNPPSPSPGLIRAAEAHRSLIKALR